MRNLVLLTAYPWLLIFLYSRLLAIFRYQRTKHFIPHAYKLGFSTALGHYCYLRMVQGTTGGPGTYTQLKEIVTGRIPTPNPEPALSDTNPGHTAFNHFVDDDVGGADTLENLVDFLHIHNFPSSSDRDGAARYVSSRETTQGLRQEQVRNR